MFKKIILLLAAIIVLGAGFFAYNAVLNRQFENQNQSASDNIKNASLKIDFGDGTYKDFSGEFKGDYSAFALLKNASEKMNFSLEIKAYGSDVFVDSINGVRGGKDNKYWMYYVNGELPMISADKNFLKAGDKVEFKFEESKF